jgi:hypothetical protein
VPHVERTVLGPLTFPRHPLAAARFGWHALRSAEGLARRFRTSRVRALLAGVAAHGMLPLDQTPSAAFGVVLVREPTWLAGSSRAAARSDCRMHSRRTFVSSGATLSRIRPCALSTNCRRRVPCGAICLRGRCCGSLAIACHAGIGASWNGIATGWRRTKWTGR